MIVNCPKCGFSQPKDQYCASCGVDMFAFRPTQKPLFTRLAQNTFFQLFLLVAVGIGVYTGINYQEKLRIAEMISQTDDTQNTQEVGKRSSEKPEPSQPARDELASTGTEPSPQQANPNLPPQEQRGFSEVNSEALRNGATQEADLATSRESLAPEERSSGQPAQARATASTTGSQAPGVRVAFTEMSANFISRLMADAEDGSSNGPYLSGVVPNIQNYIKQAESANAVDTLDSSPINPLQLGRPTVIYSGKRDEVSGQFLGFAIEITPIRLEEPVYQFQVRVWRSLRYPAGNPQIEESELPVPETFEIPKGGAAVISGTLPKKPIAESEAIYKTNKVLQILNKEQFKAGTHDLAILIEAH